MSSQDDIICASCKQNIQGKAMKAKGNYFHENHFVCSEMNCGLSLLKLPVYTKETKLFCEKHYQEKFLSKCSKCQEYVTGSCVKAMDQSWHPEHFQCYGCLVVFKDNMSFREKESRPYCEHCYQDTVLLKCAGCKEPVEDKAINALNKQWHLKCFICKSCRKTFDDGSNFYSCEGSPMCGKCAGADD